MSTNTIVLGLFEYNPVTDSNLPFNITQALNNNWDKIDSLVPLASAIASPYDSSKTYVVGSYCTYQGNLQRCNTDILTGEMWNPQHWDAVTIMSQSVNLGQVNQPNGVAGLNEQSQLDFSVIPPLDYDPSGSANSVQQNLNMHINNTNNPHQVAPQQIGALLALAAAAAYNPSGVYAVGDYCTNDSELYKCNTDIPSGEAWNVAHWTATTVAAELADVMASLSNKVMQIGAVSQEQADNLNYPCTMVGSVGPDITGLPRNGYGTMILYSYIDQSLQNGAQEVFFTDGSRYWRKAVNGSVSPWYRVAVATPPQVRDLTLQSGFAADGGCVYWITQNNIVTIVGGIYYQTGSFVADQDAQIGTLIAGFYPTQNARCSATTASGSAYIEVHTDGTVWIHPFTSDNRCWFLIQYEVVT